MTGTNASNHENGEILAKGKAAFLRRKELREMLEAPEYSADPFVYSRLASEYTALCRPGEAYREWAEIEELIPALNSSADIGALRREQDKLILKMALPSEKTVEKQLLDVRVIAGTGALAERYINRVKGAVKLLSGLAAVTENRSEKGFISARIVIEGGSGYFDYESGIHTAGSEKIEVISRPYLETNGAFDENNVRIELFHSDGAGGQNVNKVETAVRATDVATGITVVCRDERSQLQNKKKALSALRERVEEYYSRTAHALNAAAEKLHRNPSRVRSYSLSEDTAKDVRLASPCPLRTAEDFLKLLATLKSIST